MQDRTIDIMTWRREAVEKKVAALNRKAAKLGMPGVEVEFGPTYVREHDLGCPCCGGHQRNPVMPVTARGGAVKIDGWRLVAVLDHKAGARPLIRSIDGPLPELYRDAKPICNHCELDRKRNDTFVLEKNGEFKQVGRRCLADYLGESTAQAIIEQAAWFAELMRMMDRADRDEGFRSGGSEAHWDLEAFLTFTAQEIKEHGWVSRTEAKDRFDVQSTADAVLGTIQKTEYREDAEKMITEEMRKEVHMAVLWAKGAYFTENGNEYLHNIGVIAEAECTNSKNAGFAASILTAYRREVEHEIKAKLEAERSAIAGYFGESGKRVRKIEITVESTREIAGNYGTTTIIKMRTNEGHRLTWFASGNPNVDRGENYIVDLTVKDHGEYNGALETRVNRVKVLSGA